MSPSAQTTPVAVELDGAPLDRIARLAKTRKHHTHTLMREAICEYVAREEKPESFHQEAMNAWKEYKQTRLHVTGGEVIAWLETWGTESEHAAPTCHR